MSEITSKIRDYILKENYNLIESNEENIVIRFQEQIICISSVKTDKDFCTICLPIITDAQTAMEPKLLKLCNAITSKQKVVKAFLTEESIMLTYEFNWKDTRELDYHLSIGIEQVATTKIHIENAVKKAVNEHITPSP